MVASFGVLTKSSRQTAGYQAAIEYLRPGGKLMCVGLPANATLDASIFWTVFKVY